MDNIFNFDDARSYFLYALEDKKKKNPRFSLRAAATQIGTSPATLSMFMNGKKNISLETGRKITKWLKLKSSESELFLKLIELDSSRDNEIRNDISELIRICKTKPEPRTKIADFEILNDWRNVALMALYQSPVLRKKSTSQLAVIFGESEEEIEACIKKLIFKKLLTLTSEGQIQCATGIVFESAIPKKELRNFHKTMLKKASEAVEKDYAEKFIGSETFCLDKDAFELSKIYIDEFFKKMLELHMNSRKDQVYHLGLQFFKLTEHSK